MCFNGYKVFAIGPLGQFPIMVEQFDTIGDLKKTFGFMPTKQDFIELTRRRLPTYNVYGGNSLLFMHSRYSTFNHSSFSFIGIKNQDDEIIHMENPAPAFTGNAIMFWDHPETKLWTDYADENNINTFLSFHEVFG